MHDGPGEFAEGGAGESADAAPLDASMRPDAPPLGAAMPDLAEVVIAAKGLHKSFDKTIAVDGLDLAVHEGEFFGFLGPNGSGKSTTIRMLTAQLLPSAGQMKVARHDVVADPIGTKRAIGVLPEEIQTYDRLTVEELIDFVGRVHRIPRREIRKRAAELLDVMELAERDRRKLLVDCSMGMRKKAVLATALIHRPKVLFLDEPFNGIDARATIAIRELLGALRRDGMTIFFSTHILELVEKLCTRVAILDNGKIRGVGTSSELREQCGLAPDANFEDVFLAFVDRAQR